MRSCGRNTNRTRHSQISCIARAVECTVNGEENRQNCPFPLWFRHLARRWPSHGKDRVWFRIYPRGQTDTHTDRQTDRHAHHNTSPPPPGLTKLQREQRAKEKQTYKKTYLFRYIKLSSGFSRHSWFWRARHWSNAVSAHVALPTVFLANRELVSCFKPSEDNGGWNSLPVVTAFEVITASAEESNSKSVTSKLSSQNYSVNCVIVNHSSSTPKLDIMRWFSNCRPRALPSPRHPWWSVMQWYRLLLLAAYGLWRTP